MAETVATPQLEARRERWRRNKRAARRRIDRMPPAQLDEKIAAAVWAECEKRKGDYPAWLWNHPEWSNGQGRGSFEFQCDVWAAATILQLQHEVDKVSDGMIARWMRGHGLAHHYSEKSLRTMVWRARKNISIYEKVEGRGDNGPYWPKLQFQAIK